MSIRYPEMLRLVILRSAALRQNLTDRYFVSVFESAYPADHKLGNLHREDSAITPSIPQK